MALYKEDYIDFDLQTGTINRSFFNNVIGENDINGNAFGARITRNGQAEDLTGVTVMGYFIRSDGSTVIINGGRNKNLVFVLLPQSCYAVEGNFSLAIKIINALYTVTVRIVDGTVINTTQEPLIDPGNVIPSLNDYEDLTERIEAAAQTVEGISITNAQITGTRYRLAIGTT